MTSVVPVNIKGFVARTSWVGGCVESNKQKYISGFSNWSACSLGHFLWS